MVMYPHAIGGIWFALKHLQLERFKKLIANFLFSCWFTMNIILLITIVIFFWWFNSCSYPDAFGGNETTKSDQTQMKNASAVAIKDKDGESVIEEMVNKLEDEKKELEKLKNQFEKITQMSKKIVESKGHHAIEIPIKGEKELEDNFVPEDKVSRVGNYREEGRIRSKDFEEKEIKKDETSKIKIKEKEEIVKPFEIAENLYKMEEYELSLDIYLLIDEEDVEAENRSWIKYQIANCYRKLKKFDKAVEVYKEVQVEFKDSYWAKQSQWYIKNIEWHTGSKEKLEMVVE